MQASDTLQSNWQGNRRHQTQLSFGSAPGESAWVYTTVSNSCWPFVIHFVETAAMLVGSPLPGRIPEVHIISQRRQARTNRPRTQATCAENLVQFGHVCGSWDIRTDKQTDNATNRQTDRQTQYFPFRFFKSQIPAEVGNANLPSKYSLVYWCDSPPVKNHSYHPQRNHCDWRSWLRAAWYLYNAVGPMYWHAEVLGHGQRVVGPG